MSEKTRRFDLSENQLWAVFWLCFASVLIVLVMSMFHFFGTKARYVAEMVANGANPLDAKCAVSNSDDKGCMIRLAVRDGGGND